MSIQSRIDKLTCAGWVLQFTCIPSGSVHTLATQGAYSTWTNEYAASMEEALERVEGMAQERAAEDAAMAEIAESNHQRRQ